MNELVYIEKHDTGVAEIVLNNPARKNAMGAPMMRELCAAVLEVQDDDEVRAIVLRGEGGCFCSGGDLSGVASGGRKSVEESRGQHLRVRTRRLLYPELREALHRGGRGVRHGRWLQPRSGVRYGLCRR